MIRKAWWPAALSLGLLIQCNTALSRRYSLRDDHSVHGPHKGDVTLSEGDPTSEQLIRLYSQVTPALSLRDSQEHLTSNPAEHGWEQRNGVVRFSRVRHYILQKLQDSGDTQSRHEKNVNDLPPDLDNDDDADEEADEVEDDQGQTNRPLETTWHGNSYIPYRYRCQSSKFCRPGPIHPIVYAPAHVPVVPASGCMLLRWNYELPFSELPNLVFSFLATDMISGHSLQEKSRFLSALLHTGLNAFMHTNSSSLVFSIPNEVDIAFCKIKRSLEPAIKSLYQMLNAYTSRDQKPLLNLVQAAKSCLDSVEEPFPVELLPCLDFSFGSEEVLNFSQPRSIFGNPELCRRYLRYNVSKCLPARPHFCNEKPLLTLNTFAKRFYMCAGAFPHQISNKTGQDELSNEEPSEYEELDLSYARVGHASGRHTSHAAHLFGLFLIIEIFSYTFVI